MAKGIEVLMKLVGQVDKAFPKSLRDIAERTKELNVQRNKLAKQAKLFENERKLKNEIAGQVKQLRDNRNALKTLEIAKRSGINLTVKEERRYKSLTTEKKRLEQQIKENVSSYQKYRMDLQKMKTTYDQVQSEIKQTTKDLKELARQEQAMKFQNKIKDKVGGFKESVVSKVKTAAVVETGMAVGGILSSASDFIAFDTQMRKVKALTKASNEEFKMLSEEAKRLGATTKFTAEEAAIGMQKFALAGYTPKEIIESLEPVLNLATAAGEDFVMVSDMISDYMKAFGFETEDIGKAADIMANAMSRSNVTLEALGESFKYTASSAKPFQVDLAMMTSALGLMGDQGLKGGQAGTALNNALSKLSDAGVHKKLKKIGVSVKDASGKFVGLADVIQQIDTKTAKMDGLDKQALLLDIFGERGRRAVNLLLTAEKTVDGVTYKGAEAMRHFSKESENAIGAAEKMKNVMLEGPSGQWTVFKSTLSDLKLTIGEMFFDGGALEWLKNITLYVKVLGDILANRTRNTKLHVTMQEIVDKAKEFWKALKKIGKAALKVTKIINAIGIDNILVFITVFSVTTKIISFIGAMQKAFIAVKAVGGVMAALKVGIAALGGPISLIVAALAVVGYWLYKNWDKVKEWFFGLKEIFKNMWDMIVGIFKPIFSDLGKLITWLVSAYLNGFVWFYEKVASIFTAIWDFIKMVFGYIVSAVKWYIDSLVSFWTAVYLAVKTVFSNSWNFIKNVAESITNAFKDTITAIGDTAKAIWDGIKNFISNLVGGMMDKISDFKNKFKDKIVDLASSIPGVNLLFKAKKEVDGSHRSGLNYVPYDGYIAELHKGERVLTADENGSLYRELMSAKSTTTSNSYTNTNNSSPQIKIEMNNKFEGVTSETIEQITEAFSEKIRELEMTIKNLLERGENESRLSL